MEMDATTMTTRIWGQVKVENILPLPSSKIHIMRGKVWLRGKDKTLLGIVSKLLITKSFTLLPQVNFPANNLNFH